MATRPAPQAESGAILERLKSLHPKLIDLSLGRIEVLLARLGNPHLALPPVIHVAGTNGKGSTCAYLRAMLEAAGQRVHVYTSPHLVRFHERIRLAGRLIGEEMLAAVLDEVERVNDGAPITIFEVTTAAAFLAFARVPADALVLEVGLGGRLDATNVIATPAMSIITPIGLDHQQYLGNTLAEIAREKAGIIKRGGRVIIGPQEDEAARTFDEIIEARNAAARRFGQDFRAHEEHGRMIFEDGDALLDLPMPALAGRHQIANAAMAIAALRSWQGPKVDERAIEKGLETVFWPARLQRLQPGPLFENVPRGAEVWLDGGHNPHAAAALAQAMADMEEKSPRPLFMVAGMLTTKDASAFFTHFRGLVSHVCTIAVPGEEASYGAGALYDAARAGGLEAAPADDLDDALMQIEARASVLEPDSPPPRILICGSLYLAGHVLAANGMA
ncbi:MAG TPA: folylpolyglutamate synthase/dihydrofolate synthase family protein [Micropepsaceae bacterium]|nr:folylpolyglutamate synthase/dihydrofolate synthase family protein [Micropepsaceae bacterium]